jgi:DeoR family transcriptional regulator, fructose operon transcriptional repressor
MRIPEKRRIEISNLILKEKTVSVERISNLFGISPITVRRDLEKLHEKGLISKVHGGAIIREGLEPEPLFSEQIKLYKDEKERIAKEAAKLIQDGDSLILSSGSTCLGVVKYLYEKENLKIVTGGIPIANELLKMLNVKKSFEVSVCGGILTPGSNIYAGPHAISFFKKVNVDKVFISSVAISIEKGLSAGSHYDAEVSQAMIECAKEVIFLGVSSKFEKYSYINFMPLAKIDKIITDSNISQDIVKKIDELGINVTIV